jgi:quercetin dioxygenase-like cupin family protein
MSVARHSIVTALISFGGALAFPPAGLAQEQQVPSAVTRTDLLSGVLPAGDYRNLRASVVELAPGAMAPRHRHDVAVVAYVLEGIVENQFDNGAVQLHTTGEAWWEPPGTVHDVARNASTTARARLLLVYVGEEGKAATVPLR